MVSTRIGRTVACPRTRARGRSWPRDRRAATGAPEEKVRPPGSVLPGPPPVTVDILTVEYAATDTEDGAIERYQMPRLSNDKARAITGVTTVRQELTAKGLTFNQPDVAPFREKLRSAGFYAEWKGKYGDHAWELLEKSVGKLS